MASRQNGKDRANPQVATCIFSVWRSLVHALSHNMRFHRFDSVVPPQVMDHLVRRECARADRSGREFSLILFRVGGRGRRRSLAVHRLVRAMLERARFTDDVGWLGEEHLAALLPETSTEGAQAFAEGVAAMIARHGPRPSAMVYAYPRDRAAMAASAQARLAGAANTAVARVQS